MFCQECGAEINDKAVVCTHCGVPVQGRRVPGSMPAEAVPNHMVGAVLTTIFCCLIGGIIAIIYASQVNTKLALGDIEGARDASNTANNWIIANIIVGIVFSALYFVLAVAVGI